MATIVDVPEVETVAPDLKFLIDREGVNLEMQTKFYTAGIVNLRQFAAFCPSVDELRKSLLKDFGIDPESGLPAKGPHIQDRGGLGGCQGSLNKACRGRGGCGNTPGGKASSGERLQDYEEHLRGQVVEAGEGAGLSKVLHRESQRGHLAGRPKGRSPHGGGERP